jgi:hypothetical protein
MRSSRTANDWRNIWVAGFTSHKLGFNYLFYLMQIDSAFDSFQKLWKSNILSQVTKQTKNASKNSLGDLFRPLIGNADDFSIHSYAEPMIGHSHRKEKKSTTWHKDIYYPSRSGRPAALLVGKPKFSFLWEEPLICSSENLSRGHRRFYNLQEFLSILKKNKALIL